MDQRLIDYHIETLYQQDPDYIVDVLDISTEELLEHFLWKAVKYVQEEFGDE